MTTTTTITIDNKKYEIAEWFTNKNVDMICMIADRTIGNNYSFSTIRESEKAIFVQNNMTQTNEFWIPKSALKKHELVSKIMKSEYEAVKNGTKTKEYFENQFSRIFRENSSEEIYAELE